MSVANDPRALRVMLLIRSFEEEAARLLAAAEIPGFLHLSIGQEAVAAGVNLALRPTDRIATTHRGHGHCIAKGGTVDRMMGELFGREYGYCAGRSGSMHIAAPDVGILGANAIVGGGIPSAIGSAWSSQILGTDDVTVVFFGEGAVAEGVFHECVNLASLWKLPVVFVCENNQYAELSHVSTHLSSQNVVSFGAAYGIESQSGDGNDVRVVYDLARAAVDRARRGDGPTLLELSTYRLRGHFEGDGQRYRPKEEVASWRDRDPIQLESRRLVESGAFTSADVDRWVKAADAEVAKAVDTARTASDRAPSQRLLNHVYSETEVE